jgi:hypothetical protein
VDSSEKKGWLSKNGLILPKLELKAKAIRSMEVNLDLNKASRSLLDDVDEYSIGKVESFAAS